jgi:4-oxalocrotonate tautomerase
MVPVEEVADGGWGIGDQVLTLAQLQGSSSPDDGPGDKGR